MPLVRPLQPLDIESRSQADLDRGAAAIERLCGMLRTSVQLERAVLRYIESFPQLDLSEVSHEWQQLLAIAASEPLDPGVIEEESDYAARTLVEYVVGSILQAWEAQGRPTEMLLRWNLQPMPTYSSFIDDLLEADQYLRESMNQVALLEEDWPRLLDLLSQKVAEGAATQPVALPDNLEIFATDGRLYVRRQSIS